LIGDLTIDGLVWVMGHLRAKDQLEVEATIARDDIDSTCQLLWMLPGLKWEARSEFTGVPAVVGGVVPIWPGLAAGWMFGTEGWEDVALEVTRTVKKNILPKLDHLGVHRVECRPIAGNDAAVRWLELMGFRREAVTAQFGRGREDFVLFARTTGHDAKHAH
jgi:hypothetical protein